MSPKRRAAIFFLSIATVVAVGLMGIKAIKRTPMPAWPDRIAVVGLDHGKGREPISYLAIADPVRRAVVVIPSESVIEVPGAGFLRAFQAYRIGGIPLLRSALGRLFGIDVPFSVSGEGRDFHTIATGFTASEIEAGRLSELRKMLRVAATQWEIKTVAGVSKVGPGGSVVILDRVSVADAAHAIGGLGTKVFVDPTQADQLVVGAPSASPAPTAIPAAQISIDVFNGGPMKSAAARIADKLRAKGYQVRKVGDIARQARASSVVYFKPGISDAKAKQIGAELGYPLEGMPDALRSDSDVVVVIGVNPG